MTMSPAASSGGRARRSVASVTPAGTITQTARGGGQLRRPARPGSSTSETSGLRSIPDDLVPGRAQPLAHVAAHPAQTDQTELHVLLLPLRAVAEPGRLSQRATRIGMIR